MGTVIRTSISKRNEYWISKERYLELKHFCLQYYDFKKEYSYILTSNEPDSIDYSIDVKDLTGGKATKLANCSRKMKMIEDCAYESDSFLSSYIFKAVTEDRSYVYLRTVMDIPCGKDYYYTRYRRFFWLLNDKRD